MPPITSFLLDALRVVAALIVFFGHISQWWFYPEGVVSDRASHDAVTLFFVLSGYLIAFSIKGHRRRTATDYALARLSRLYSVVAPAVILTALLLLIGMQTHNAFYQWLTRGHDGLRLLFAACFLQELWFLSASPPTNAPLWSLGFEFWYYALFGVWIYGRHCRAGRCLLAGLLLFVGPKILLLFPVWVMGATALFAGQRVRLSPGRAMLGLIFSITLLLLLFATSWRGPFPLFQHPLFGAGWFLSDYCFGALYSIVLFFFDAAFLNRSIPAALARWTKVGADMSFSLYLYHFPLLVFAAALVPFDHHSGTQTLGVAACVFAATLLLSRITEARRAALHRWLARLAERLLGTTRRNSN